MTTPDRVIAGQFRSALLELITFAINNTDVQIVTGRPSVEQSFEIISIGAVDSERVPATQSPQRTFEERIRAEVLISVWLPGGDEADSPAHTRAFELLGVIDHAIRMDDTTVRGTVYQCWLDKTRTESDPFTVDNTDGRVTEILAEFVATARVTK